MCCSLSGAMHDLESVVGRDTHAQGPELELSNETKAVGPLLRQRSKSFDYFSKAHSLHVSFIKEALFLAISCER